MNPNSENRSGSNSLAKTMARGGGIVGSGLLISRFLQFLNTLIVVRIISRADYGIISLSTAVVSVTVMLCLLGLNAGVSRYIAKHRARNDDRQLGRILCTSLTVRLRILRAFICRAVLLGLEHCSGPEPGEPAPGTEFLRGRRDSRIDHHAAWCGISRPAHAETEYPVPGTDRIGRHGWCSWADAW